MTTDAATFSSHGRLPTTGHDTAPGARGSDYARLAQAVRDAGLLDRRPVAYTVRGVLTIGAYAAVCVLVVALGDTWWQLLTAAAFGVVFGQIAFLGHDAGHQAVFASRRRNDALGRALANLFSGLSYGWWLDTHNRPHANPNKEGSDPDIGDGVLAFTTAQAAKRSGRVSRFVTRRQAWLFFPLTLLEGISLHVDSVLSVARDHERSPRGGSRRTEATGLVLHVVAYAALLFLVMPWPMALAFAGVHQATWGLYMSCTFAPAHKGMPLIAPETRLDFLRRQVLTSRDVHGGRLTDFALGGLNYQIEHHLFPSMPRDSLRRAQPLIRAYCAELGLVCTETSLLDSYRAVLAHLDAIGAPLRTSASGHAAHA